jgi:hypothetical protein
MTVALELCEKNRILDLVPSKITRATVPNILYDRSIPSEKLFTLVFIYKYFIHFLNIKKIGT